MRHPPPALSLLFIVLASGCGTTATLTNSDTQISQQLVKSKTGCESIPRVYSGVSYDMCKLNSNPDSTFYNPFLFFYLLDMPVSAVADTLVVPATIYTQSQKGNIEISR